MHTATTASIAKSGNSPSRHHELCPGQDISIQFHKSQTRYNSTIVGMERYKYGICRLPLATGLESMLNHGAGLTVRYEQSGTLYGFQGRVVDCLMKEHPLLLFSYPKRIETVRLRRHARVRCMLPARAACENYDFHGFLGDISMGGCRMIIPPARAANIRDFPMNGDTIRLTFPLENLMEFSCQTLIKQAKATPGGFAISFEFQFGDNIPRSFAGFMEALAASSPRIAEQLPGLN